MRALSQVDLWWAMLGLGLTVASVHVGVYRWRLLLGATTAPWTVLFRAFNIGQTLNILLPIRGGEIYRAHALGRAAGIPFARGLATLAIEKLLDLVMIAAVVALMGAAGLRPAWIQPTRLMVTLAVVIGLTLVVVVGIGSGRLHRLTGRWAFAADVAAGLRVLRGPSDAVFAGMLSVMLMLLLIETYVVMFAAMKLSLPLSAAVLLTVTLLAGNLLVSVPGNLGVFHYLAMLVLVEFGVDRNTALAYAIAAYGVTVVPKVVLGAALWAWAPAGA